MAKHRNETAMGGGQGSFRTTHWSQIDEAGTLNEDRRKACVDILLSRYWKPVYSHLRYKGHDNERAKDLTQGFFHEVVLGRELIQRADQTKGKFRTFLLSALDRYVTSVYRKETARKRLPEGGMAQMDAVGLADLPLEQSKATPELAFHYTWATNLLDEVFAIVREEYCSTGRAAYWEIFQARIVGPILENSEAPSLTDLAERHGLEGEKKASNIIITVKRRFATALRHHLRLFVQSDSEAEDEFRELVKILSQGGTA